MSNIKVTIILWYPHRHTFDMVEWICTPTTLADLPWEIAQLTANETEFTIITEVL